MRLLVTAFTFFTLALHWAQGQVPVVVTARNVELTKIQPAAITTPDFTVKFTEPKRAEFLKWFEIEVEFEVKGIELVDELTFKYDVLINGKLCPGEVSHINIPKGKPRYSVMYISPRNLDRITGGKLFTAAMLDNIWVTISRQGQALAITSLKGKSLTVPNLPQTAGMLSPKSETPFQVLWWDRYEAVKLPSR
ncbi:MAG: Amuc_1102 family pilus-like protein [Chthoniobacteraceae bacterium]